MEDRSAIHFAESLRVPLCIVYPEDDTRAPLKPVLGRIWKLVELGRAFEARIASGPWPPGGQSRRRAQDRPPTALFPGERLCWSGPYREKPYSLGSAVKQAAAGRE